jgi:hypothetical protein
MIFEEVFKVVFDINCIVYDPQGCDSDNTTTPNETLGLKGTPSNPILIEEDPLSE